MSKADELLRRMDRLGQAAAPTPPAAPPPAPSLSPPPPRGGGGTSPRPRTGGGRRRRVAGDAGAVRYTLDLEHDLRRVLCLYALDHRVDASEVMRTLIELLDEPTVAELVASRLAIDPGSEPLTGLIRPEQRSQPTSLHDPPNGLSGQTQATHRTPP